MSNLEKIVGTRNLYCWVHATKPQKCKNGNSYTTHHFSIHLTEHNDIDMNIDPSMILPLRGKK